MESLQTITEARAELNSIAELDNRIAELALTHAQAGIYNPGVYYLDLYVFNPGFEYYHLNRNIDGRNWDFRWHRPNNQQQVSRLDSGLFRVVAERNDGTRSLRMMDIEEHFLVLDALESVSNELIDRRRRENV